MSLVGLQESEKLAEKLRKQITRNFTQQSKEIKTEIQKIQYLLDNQDKAPLVSWRTQQASNDRIANLIAQLNDVEKLYLSAGDTKAGKIFKDRMTKQLRQRLTNLKANELEVKIRLEKAKVQAGSQMRQGLTSIRREGSLREMYDESRSAGGFLSNFGRAYLDDAVTFETKTAGSKTLGEYMSNLYRTYEKGLRDVYVSGIVRGDSYSKMEQNLMKATNITAGKAKLLVRTEANAVFNESVKNAIQDNPLVKGYRFRATLDSHTSSICQKHDGQYIPKDQVKPGINFPPLHPNCRSTVTTVLITESEKEDTVQRYTKNGSNLWIPVPPGTTYAEYKRKFLGVAEPKVSEPEVRPNEEITAQERVKHFDDNIGKAAKVELPHNVLTDTGTDYEENKEAFFRQTQKSTQPKQVCAQGSEEEAVIIRYTGLGSRRINKTCRDIYSKGEQVTEENLKRADILTSTLYRGNIGQETRVTRRVYSDCVNDYLELSAIDGIDPMLLRSIGMPDRMQGIVDAVNSKIDPTKSMTFKQPQSTTFVEGAFGRDYPVMLEILAPEDTPGLSLESVTAVGAEYEYLIPPGVKYRMLRAKSGEDNSLVLQLEIISGDYDIPEEFSRTLKVLKEDKKL